MQQVEPIRLAVNRLLEGADRRAGLNLPPDLQAAGRGEIAPSSQGS